MRTYAVLLIFSIVGCMRSEKRETCTSHTYFNLSMGIVQDDYTALDAMDSAMLRLNASDEAAAIQILRRNYKVDTFFNNGYVGLVVSQPKSDLTNYLLYRYLELVGDLDPNSLTRVLVSDINLDNNCIRTLIEQESLYLSFYSKKIADQDRKTIIDSIKKRHELFPNSLRIKYILANIYYASQLYDEALKLYLDLINQNYYKFNCLKRLIKHYELLNSDSLRYYVKLAADLFPQKCVPQKIALVNSDSEIYEVISSCSVSLSKKDSIEAKVLSAKIYLTNENFEMVSRILKSYFSNNTEFILDSLRLWERGEYYDIQLRYFFVKKQYKNFSDFVIKKMGYNPKISVENERDFYELVQTYYTQYINSSIDGFDAFFNKHFVLKFPARSV